MVNVLTIACLIISYLLGNISPATIMGKIHGVDIRKQGSGNPGTTNTLRVLGAKSAAVTLLIDILKGVAAVLIGRYIIANDIAAYACGTLAFLGHVYPFMYKFKGGKGIATGFGILVTLDWRVGLIALACAVLGVLLSKRMSVGSIAAAVSVPITCGIFNGAAFAVWGCFLAGIVIWRHRSNIQRIIRGEEPPLGFLDKNKKKGSGNE